MTRVAETETLSGAQEFRIAGTTYDLRPSQDSGAWVTPTLATGIVFASVSTNQPWTVNIDAQLGLIITMAVAFAFAAVCAFATYGNGRRKWRLRSAIFAPIWGGFSGVVVAGVCMGLFGVQPILAVALAGASGLGWLHGSTFVRRVVAAAFRLPLNDEDD